MSSLHGSITVVPIVGPSRPRPWECTRTARMGFLPVQRAMHSLVIMGLAWTLTASTSLAIDVSSERGRLSLVNRSVTQDQGAWVVDYRLRYTGETGVVITPEKIAVKVKGWVSNSRVVSHALPRWSSLVIAHGPDLSAISEVVAAADDAQRCRERLVVSVWTEDGGPFSAGLSTPNNAKTEGSQPLAAGLTEPTTVLPLSLGPDAIVRVRLRLEHQHILYGEYDPLLAMRVNSLSRLPWAWHRSVTSFPWIASNIWHSPNLLGPSRPRTDVTHTTQSPDLIAYTWKLTCPATSIIATTSGLFVTAPRCVCGSGT